MNDYRYFHEKEIVELKSSVPKPRKNLHKVLVSSGFKSEDEFYFLDRIEKAKPWQSISVMTLDVFLNDEPVYETKEDINETGGGTWDQLNASYLLASLPVDNIDKFCDKVFLLADQFNLKVYYQGNDVNKTELPEIFNTYAKDLSENYSEPGSEDLGILIQYTYPR